MPVRRGRARSASLALLSLLFFLPVCGCSSGGGGAAGDAVGGADLAPAADGSGPASDGLAAGETDGGAPRPACDEAGRFDPAFADWSAPVAPRRRTVGAVEVVWLSGTPYEMGQQHGELLLDVMTSVWAAAQAEPLLGAFFVAAERTGLLDVARAATYPEVLEECQGFVDFVGAHGVDFTLDHCVFLASGELIEFVVDGMPRGPDIVPGCTQIIATGAATADGRLYHARLMDWLRLDFVIENPVVFVRQPQGGVPHVTIAFPGGMSPFQGMNAHGLVAAQNEVHARDNSVHDLVGNSHTQLGGRILAQARTLAEARAMVLATNHMTLEISGVSSAADGAGELYEMAPVAVGVRTMVDDLLFTTNHFVAPATADLDKDPPADHTLLRWDRLTELLLPDGADSLYGRLAPETLVQVLRDRRNPWTGELSPDVFDDGSSLATDGAIYAVVFDPADRLFWLASKQIVVPDQTFQGFSLGALLELPGCAETTPADIP
jgi:hypothetical protein